MADAFTSTATSSLSGANGAPPAPTTGALRCPGCGVEGSLRPEGFWQCPVCAIRLDPAPADGETGAISIHDPQPIKQQELQLVPAAQQPAAHLISSMIPTLDLTAPVAVPAPEAATGGYTEPPPTDTPSGGRAGDTTLGTAAEPYEAPTPPAPVSPLPPLEPKEAPGRIDPVPFIEPSGAPSE